MGITPAWDPCCPANKSALKYSVQSDHGRRLVKDRMTCSGQNRTTSQLYCNLPYTAPPALKQTKTPQFLTMKEEEKREKEYGRCLQFIILHIHLGVMNSGFLYQFYHLHNGK